MSITRPIVLPSHTKNCETYKLRIKNMIPTQKKRNLRPVARQKSPTLNIQTLFCKSILKQYDPSLLEKPPKKLFFNGRH